MKNRPAAARPWKGRVTLRLNNEPLRWDSHNKSLCPVAASNIDKAKEPVFHIFGIGTREVADRETVPEVNKMERDFSKSSDRG
jgi:hypothetical protein